MRKKVSIVMAVCLAVLLAASLYHGTESRANSLEIRQTQNITTQGLYDYDLTFDNLVNKYSSHIATASVEELAKGKNTFKVRVQEPLLGTFEKDNILVYVDEHLLEIGETYVFFLRKFDDKAYPEDFFVQNSDFIVKLDDDKLLLLKDPLSKEYDKPFIQDKYNNFSEMKKYIDSIKDKNEHLSQKSHKLLVQPEDNQQLMSLADHIIEITPDSLVEDNGYVKSVLFKLEERFKGADFKNKKMILVLPTDQVDIGKKHLVFLEEVDGGGLDIVSRKGSVISETSENYHELRTIVANTFDKEN
ncbi:hypothetical protein LOK74_03880 [Brevibacillus humidisoli]|uniref:hypothetical protein n=1 Tax=Brevibacillus humidisoli TaxID=2895522 RepID=UPI001E37C8B6|nr:hypothetical protein [Brevibacillus humidisoli]UFJ41664.1 hypothetical protein LOK74_03880 [Brevibacillus humidisoli]